MGVYDDYSTYGIDPWSDITLNERPWYDPMLRDIYMRSAVYSPFVTFNVDLNGPTARTIYFNDLIPPRPNIAAITARVMESTRLFTDSFQREVTTSRYGNGMAFHRESQMFHYWQKNGNIFGILNIINNGLGQVIVDHLDKLRFVLKCVQTKLSLIYGETLEADNASEFSVNCSVCA